MDCQKWRAQREQYGGNYADMGVGSKEEITVLLLGGAIKGVIAFVVH